jgi:hypothetical protein
VLKSAAGKTVEVINTDAEGRLILGDGLWYARKLGATHLVDVATLTGAVVVALGKITSGLFGAPEAWVDQVRRAADRAGDRAWPMPLFDEYRDQIKSDIADMMNTGGRAAGSITAAMFLKEFADGLPWVHMDIAGTAWADEAKPYLPKGPSGVAVRTLAALAFESSMSNDLAAWQQPPPPRAAHHRQDHPAGAQERSRRTVGRPSRIAGTDRHHHAWRAAARCADGGRDVLGALADVGRPNPFLTAARPR